MFFKLTYLLDGMHASHQDDLPFEYQISADQKISFWQRKIQHDGKMTSTLCVDLIRAVDPPARAKETLFALLSNRLILDNPIQDGLPYNTLAETVVDLDGNILPNWIIPFRILPSGARPWLYELSKDMSEYLVDLIKCLRWRQNASGSHSPFRMVDFIFSNNGSFWSSLPRDTGGRVVLQRGLNMQSTSLSEVSKLMTQGVGEPFAHELLREAQTLSTRAPRSALLIACVALETAAKSFIVELVPDAKEVIEKLPSPPVLTLLQEILPPLIKRKKNSVGHFPLRKDTSNYLRKWVQKRNLLAHSHKLMLDSEDLDEFILFVSDVLYSLDSCRGCEWAAGHIETSLMKSGPI